MSHSSTMHGVTVLEKIVRTDHFELIRTFTCKCAKKLVNQTEPTRLDSMPKTFFVFGVLRNTRSKLNFNSDNFVQ